MDLANPARIDVAIVGGGVIERKFHQERLAHSVIDIYFSRHWPRQRWRAAC